MLAANKSSVTKNKLSIGKFLGEIKINNAIPKKTNVKPSNHKEVYKAPILCSFNVGSELY